MVSADEVGITRLEFTADDAAGIEGDENSVILQCITQLDEYFAGVRTEFNLPLYLSGTDFQKKAWRALQDIPYNTAVSYKYIAQKIDNEKAVRAVGNANNKNPVPIIIPCHRVIGSDGSLTGYGGGLWRKKWLLEHEAKTARKAA